MITNEIKELIKREALFVINHSGGKDSQCMTIEMQKIIPAKNLLIVHAHLPEQEWDGTWGHILNTINLYHYRVKKVIAVKTFFDMVERRQKWPGAQQRQCTSDLKRGPIEKAIRHHIKENNLPGLVVNCMGIRAQESPARSKQIPFRFNKRNSKAGREWYDWLPIFQYKIEKVFNIIKQAGQIPHYAYQLGMSRLSCCFCILANKSDLRISAKYNKELFERICQMEKDIGHTMHMHKKEPIGLREYLEL